MKLKNAKAVVGMLEYGIFVRGIRKQYLKKHTLIVLQELGCPLCVFVNRHGSLLHCQHNTAVLVSIKVRKMGALSNYL